MSAILARLLRAPGRRSGDVFRVFMVGYFAFRLAVESLKTDPTLAGLTAIRWASAAVLVYYAAAVRARRAHVDLQTAR